MKTLILSLICASILVFGSVSAQVSLTVSTIKVEGNVRSDQQAILRIMRTMPGEPIVKADLSEDIKRIYQLGFYADIQMILRQEDGQQVLIVQVVEKPSIRKILYVNNDALSDEEIKEVVDIRPYAALNPTKLTQTAEKIRDLYVEKGYFLAEINWTVKKTENNQVDVTFEILEKDEVSVARIDIIDKSDNPDAEFEAPIDAQYIKDRLETREGGLLVGIFGGGTYKSDAFDRDVSRIGHFFWDRGYIKAKVGTPKVELSPDRREIYITIPIVRGKRYKTGALDITGELLREKSVLMSRVKLDAEDWFSTGRLRGSIESIGRIYKDDGYAYVNITPNTRSDDDKRQMDVTFNIKKGEKVRIERIDIIGNERTRDKVIRRELRLYEGEYYSTTGLERSERLINRLGYFEPGSVRIQTRNGSTPNSMNLVIEVKEKPTGSFQIGAGFSTVENFVGQAQISQNNLFGRGQTLSFQGNFSSIRSIANVRFYEPYFLDSRVNFGLNLYRFENVYSDFTRQSHGGDLTLGYPLSDDWGVSSTYKLEEVSVRAGGFSGVSNDDSRLSIYGSGLTSSMRLTLYYDTRNNRLFPTGGIYVNTSAEHAPNFLLSENQFTRYRAQGRFYYGLGLGVVAKLRTDWGMIFGHDENGVPLFERFFVGGPLTVRGFQRNTLSPTMSIISGGVPYGTSYRINEGGTEQILLNAEIEYPIFQQVGVRGVFFFDGGNAFQVDDALASKVNSLRYAWGFGIRWISPMGPLRFEWGFPLAPRDNEQSSVFEFSIGNFF